MRFPEGVEDELELLDDLDDGKEQGKGEQAQKRKWGESLMRRYSQEDFQKAFKTR